MQAPVPTAGIATVTANQPFTLKVYCNWPFYLPDIDTVSVVIVDNSTGLTAYSSSNSVSVGFGSSSFTQVITPSPTLFVATHTVIINVLRSGTAVNATTYTINSL